MIIDAHCHLVDEKWLPRKWWEGVAKVAIPVLKKMGMVEVTAGQVIEQIMPGIYFDPTGEKQLAAMDEAGIDKAVILPLDYGLPIGEAPVSIEEVNKVFADLQKRHPDRFIAFVSVDPRRRGAADLVRRALDDWGMRGLKLHPGSGFFPNGKETRRLLKKIADYKIPVICHTGAILEPLYSKGCDPLWLDELCADFPDQIVVAAHLGHGYGRQLNHLGACKTNLWTDISDLQRRASHEFRYFCESLRGALDSFGPDRVLFGTDGPYLRPVLSDKDYVQLVRDLPSKSPEGISFTNEEVEAILGGNAARLYDL